MVEGYSEGPFLPMDGGVWDCWQDFTESLDAGSDFFFSSFSGDGEVRSKEKTFPKTTVGWWWWRWEEEEVGFFSLLNLEDQATEHKEAVNGHQEHDQDP